LVLCCSKKKKEACFFFLQKKNLEDQTNSVPFSFRHNRRKKKKSKFILSFCLKYQDDDDDAGIFIRIIKMDFSLSLSFVSFSSFLLFFFSLLWCCWGERERESGPSSMENSIKKFSLLLERCVCRMRVCLVWWWWWCGTVL